MGTKIKICGVTDPADAHQAADLGAWAVGLIFWPESPRACSPDAADEIGAVLRRRLEIVGVFVNATLDEVALAADRYSLSILQLHGDEGPAYCREAARRTGCRVMKAARIRDAASVRDLGAFRTDIHLLDTHVTGRRGGTGEPFDWALVNVHPRKPPIVLSGGLRPDNVAEAIEDVGPWAVDTASGTEAEPGRKDPALVQAFFEAVAAADYVEAPGDELAAAEEAPAAEEARA